MFLGWSRLFHRAQNPTGLLTIGFVEGTRGERQRNGRAEEHGRSNGCGTRQEVGTARGAKKTTRGARTKGGTQIRALAVLHEDQNDHDYSGDDLQNKSNAEQEMHG